MSLPLCGESTRANELHLHVKNQRRLHAAACTEKSPDMNKSPSRSPHSCDTLPNIARVWGNAIASGTLRGVRRRTPPGRTGTGGTSPEQHVVRPYFVATSAALACLLQAASIVAQSTTALPPASSGRALGPAADARSPQAVIDRYCLGCHNARTKSGNFVLEGMDLARAGDHAEGWEKVVRKLRAGVMPPAGRSRPDEDTYRQLRAAVEGRLDQAAAARPDPGRTEAAHRLNRLEYANAIRDLLAIEINAPDLLPADDSSYGFDNIAGVLKISGALMERYLTAARDDQPARRRQPAACRRHVGRSVCLGSSAARTARRTAVWDARRHLDPPQLPARRRVRHQGRRAGRGTGAPEQLEDQHRRRAPEAVRARRAARGSRRQRSASRSKAVRTTSPSRFLARRPTLVEQVREPFLNPDAPQAPAVRPVW